MGRDGKNAGVLRLAAVLLALLFACAPLHTAQAGGFAMCTLPQASTDDPRDAYALASTARCNRDKVDLNRHFNVAKVYVQPGDTPRHVISRAAKFSAMHIGVEVDGAVRWESHQFEDIPATFFDRQFSVPTPDYEGQADAVFVMVEGTTQATTFDHLRLEEHLPGSSDSDRAFLMLIALLTGMMLMPILFDVVFFRVLREKFILWHAALVAGLATQLVCTYGLYAAFFDVRLPVIRLVTIGSFSLMVAAAVMFSLQFIEPGKLSQRIRKWVIGLTIVFCAVSAVHLAGIEALGRWSSIAYFSLGGPLALAVIVMLVSALRNGSRTARFLVVGLSPLIAVALTRVVTFVLPGVPVTDANGLLLVATVIEVTATALGVASRFLALKLDRDRTRAEKDMLEDQAGQDALTGLRNRRTLDKRFGELRAQGFDTFALIDIDRFKDINDRFGHQTGDAVLKGCAGAIRNDGDRDTIALRLGGEEFVLLLRGPNAVERAEALRQAIPRRIAAEVPDLDRLVTASMGIVELPRGANDLMDFDALYARADTLMYEAKAAGRNRMLYERLQVFDEPERSAPQKSAKRPVKAA